MDIVCRENLPSKYKNAVEKLLFNIKNATKLSEIRKLFNEFSQIYTVIPVLWLEWIRLEQNPRFPDFKLTELNHRRKKIKLLANTHFCSKKYFILDKNAIETGNFEQSLHFPWQNYSKIAIAKCDSPNFTTEGLEKALEFPHSELKNVMEFCKKSAVRPIPASTVKQYKKSLKIYEKIVESNSEHENWLSSIRETKNENFVIQSFEYRLSESPFDTKLWKLYLKYLNEKQPISMLNVYLRYCRIFIEDFGAKKKYWNLIELIGSFKKDVTKWWLDCVHYEKSFETFDSAFAFLKKILSSKTIHPDLFLEYLFWFEKVFPNRTCFKNLKEQFPAPKNNFGILQYPKSNYSSPMKTLNFKVPKNPTTKTSIPTQSLQDSINNFYENQSCQDFSLPSTVIYYILNTCNSVLLSKFQKSCKYFYFRKSIPLCHKLTVTDSTSSLQYPTFNHQSLFITSSNLNSIYLNYLKITNTLYINCSNDFKVFSKLSSKVKFDIQHLHLLNQDLKIEELEKLECSKIKSLDLQNVTIKDGKDKNLPMEDIIARFPAASYLNLCLSEFTPKTAQKLAALNRSCKFEYFKICNLEDSFDPKSFAEFILKNYTKNTKSVISFSAETDVNFKNNFEKIVKKEIKCWKNAG